jgi:hypothetical protein
MPYKFRQSQMLAPSRKMVRKPRRSLLRTAPTAHAHPHR